MISPETGHTYISCFNQHLRKPIRGYPGRHRLPVRIDGVFMRTAHRRNRPKRHRNTVLPWVSSNWWTPSNGGGYREGVVIRHNELTELDLTITHGWTYNNEPVPCCAARSKGCVSVRVFFREAGAAGNTGEVMSITHPYSPTGAIH